MMRPLQATTAGWRAAQRNDMADLQEIFMNDDALDYESQYGLSLGKRGAVEPILNAVTEGFEIRQRFCGFDALAV
jgi:hypothetical protein